MYKRKSIKIIALLLTLCLLVTAFSGTAIQVQAEELAANVSAIASSTAYPFYFRHFYDEASFTAAKRQYINSAVSFTNQTIKVNMLSVGLSVTIGSSANYIQADTITPMHDCPLPMDEPCANPLGCGSFALHHKDTKRISQYMYNARTEAAHHFRAIW